jgi:Tol biopolymer transport system component
MEYVEGETLAARLTRGPLPLAQTLEHGAAIADALGAAHDRGIVHRDIKPANVIRITRQGVVQPVRDQPGFYLWPRLSRNGRHVALVIQSPNNTLWTHDIDRGVLTRVPSQGDVVYPAWTPDGDAIVYSASWDRGQNTLMMTNIDGTGERRLFQSTDTLDPQVVSPDGQFAIISRVTAATRSDLWVVPLTGTEQPWPLLQSTAEELDATLSPDGKWFAYASNEAGPGRYEVYVCPFPGPGGRQQISTGGGIAAVWAPSGREIFYRERDRVMVVSVQPGSTFAFSTPQLLFTLSGRYRDEFDVSPDGQRFIMVQLMEKEPVTRIDMILDWVHLPSRRTADR